MTEYDSGIYGLDACQVCRHKHTAVTRAQTEGWCRRRHEFAVQCGEYERESQRDLTAAPGTAGYEPAQACAGVSLQVSVRGTVEPHKLVEGGSTPPPAPNVPQPRELAAALPSSPATGSFSPGMAVAGEPHFGGGAADDTAPVPPAGLTRQERNRFPRGRWLR